MWGNSAVVTFLSEQWAGMSVGWALKTGGEGDEYKAKEQVGPQLIWLAGGSGPSKQKQNGIFSLYFNVVPNGLLFRTWKWVLQVKRLTFLKVQESKAPCKF